MSSSHEAHADGRAAADRLLAEAEAAHGPVTDTDRVWVAGVLAEADPAPIVMQAGVLELIVQHTDVGFTYETQIRLGDRPLVTYRPGTRHLAVAMSVALDVLADALGPLLAAAARANDCMQIVCNARTEDPAV